MRPYAGSFAVAFVAAILGAALVWTVERLIPASAPDAARTEQVVHDYLLAHPEIIPQAMDALRDRAHTDVISANRDAILKPFGSAWLGSANPDVTLVEYYDYNCGYCRASLPTIAALLKSDPKLRVVFREFPVLSDASVDAARMSLAAAAQGKFKPFHDALYAAGPVSGATIAASARVAGVDVAKAAAFTPQAEAEIASNMSVARQLGLTGTPSWVIGNRVVSSALTLDALQKAVAAARAAK
jgi:protein-disulfide isomerase